MFGLFKRDPGERRYLFSFVPDETEQDILRYVSKKSPLYSMDQDELVALGKVDYYIYQYEPTSLSAVLVRNSDGSVDVVCGNTPVGHVPKRKIKHALFATDGDYEATVELSGGPYKVIYVDEDEPRNSLDRYWDRRYDEDIKIKVKIAYD